MLVTQAEATLYFENRPLCQDWQDLIIDERMKYLSMASAKIEKLNFIGSVVSPYQTTLFPRAVRTNSSRTFSWYGPSLFGNYNTIEGTPEEIKAAVCEEAFAMFKFMGLERYSLQEQGVRTASRGGLSESYESYRPMEEILSYLARQYLSGWITTTAEIR